MWLLESDGDLLKGQSHSIGAWRTLTDMWNSRQAALVATWQDLPFWQDGTGRLATDTVVPLLS